MRRDGHWILVIVLFALVCAPSAPLAQSLPSGYRLVTGAPQVSGGVLVAKIPGGPGATQALARGLRDTARFFDRRPLVVGAVMDAANQQAQAAFRTAMSHRDVVGVALAGIEGTTATVAMVFDTPNTFPQSFPRLLQLAGIGGAGGGAPCPPAGQNWRTFPYFDGSGQMTLPDGWRLTAAQQGVARAEGPHGIVESGISFSAISRAGAAQRAQFGLPTLVAVADPTDLASAVVGIWASVVQTGMIPPFRIRRVIETLPVPSEGYIRMQAGFVHYEIEHETGVKRVLALVHMAPIDADGQWLYTESHILAPATCFGQNLPTLFQIWTSAQVAPQEFQRRLNAAMSSLNEAHEMQWQGMRNQSRRQDNMFANWHELYVGRVIEDTPSGRQTVVDLGHSTELVNKLNEREPGRYREIPLRELNRE